ncbi:MAG: transcription antitermination factor NusB [Planctomycetes bacterium]|nr:transcription antitermination factor NusB [Planctomycetota bacterium]
MNQNHRSRRLALQGLCCLDVQGLKVRDLVDEFISDSQEPPMVIEAARELLANAMEEEGQADELLTRHARHWELGRLAMVDRNILRLSVYELRKSQAPTKVIISEALKLAQEFSTAESPRFINGVLDAVAKEIRGQVNPAAGEKD